LLSQGAEILIHMPQIGGSVTYNADSESIPEVIDLRTAAATQLLGGLAGRAVEDRRADLKQKVQLARQKRRTINTSQMLVILQATGDVEDFELKVHERA